MNKYKVKITHIFYEIFDVEASNEEEAKTKVESQIQNTERVAEPKYEVTIPKEHWAVLTEEKFNELVKNFNAQSSEENK